MKDIEYNISLSVQNGDITSLAKDVLMTYLEEFKTQINARNLPRFLQLWEEYCMNDRVDVDEFVQLLQLIKNSELAKSFGKFVETALPLWKIIADKSDSYRVIKLLIDLQTTNTPLLADTAFEVIREKYGQQPLFNERLRLTGLRSRENFQGAIANYELLDHFVKGNFVLHIGGLGAGEIMDVAPLRQQLTLEFEHASGLKQLTFENAFKSLVPLPKDNFLVRRFAEADALESMAREDHLGVIKLLLRDLGPKTAAEIKDELCELVIPEKDWVKWWQAARSKIKKDTMIESPATPKDPFVLRKTEQSQEERLEKAIQQKIGFDDIIHTSYNFIRDLPNIRKNQDVRNSVKEKLLGLFQNSKVSNEQELQLCIFLESQFSHEVEGKKTSDIIQRIENIDEVIHHIDIIALKKRALTLVREYRKDWAEIFLRILFTIKHSVLRDYLLKELLAEKSTYAMVEKKLQELIKTPETHPDCFLWYFQKIFNKEDSSLPFANKKGEYLFFESFLLLLNHLETKPEHRELTKKMYSILSGKRYALVRSMFEEAELAYVKEFLLLASKCQTLTDHDIKILHSLAEVVYPELAVKKKKNASHMDTHVTWTTEDSYFKMREKIRHIGTIEMVENAKEIEAARALGDLRENSEFKFALEKRSRLQNDLKALSDQFNRARIITKEDIHPDEVGIGCIVDIIDQNGNKIRYTILGPWDANTNDNILSFQSKLAETLIGAKEGEKVMFKDDELTIVQIKGYFDK